MTDVSSSSKSVLQSDSKLQKAPKLPVVDNLNWFIHLNYVKKEYKICKDIIREQLLSTNGLCEYALYVQGLILRQEGRIQESLESFQTCAALNPSNVQNLKQIARSLFLLGRHKAAIDVYNEALKISSNDWEIIHNLGICYVHINNNEKAKGYFKDSINISKSELSFQMLAKLYVKESNNQLAIETLTKAIEHNAESCELLTLLGLLYMKERQYQKAFESLGNALTYNPTHYRSILAVCNMIQIHNDFDVALNKYRIAADTAPESSRLWNNIGMCFFGKKKYVAAISCLKRATYLSPFEWKILYNLGLIHLTIQQYASAFRYLSAGINFRPKEPLIYSLLAIALTHLNDHSNAKDAYEHALTLDPENVYTNLNYAIFLFNQGDRRNAATKLLQFRKSYESLVQTKRRDVDPELQATAAKLGPILHIGEIPTAQAIVSKSNQNEQQPQGQQQQQPPQQQSNDSSKKYQDLSNNDLYRESTMASVSNVAMSGANSNRDLYSAMSVRTNAGDVSQVKKDKEFDSENMID